MGTALFATFLGYLTIAEFVVIDNIQLAEGSDGGDQLVVTLDLSTYFRVMPS